MDLTVPSEVREFAAAAARALADPNLQRARAAAAGALALDELMERIDDLGVSSLDCGSNPVEALAAAHFALEAGRTATPLPIAALLTGVAAGRAGMIYAVEAGGGVHLLNFFSSASNTSVIDLEGCIYPVLDVVAHERSDRSLAPNASLARIADEGERTDPRLWALHEVFTAFFGLGALDSAMQLACDHVKSRHQFGKPLARFQGIQERLADAGRLRAGLWELCHYTIWRFFAIPEAAVADALALRAYYLEAIEDGFRHLHQVHGAIGFTSEYDLTVLSAALQVSRYCPLTRPATLRQLGRRLDQLDALFPLQGLSTDRVPTAR